MPCDVVEKFVVVLESAVGEVDGLEGVGANGVGAGTVPILKVGAGESVG